MKKTTVAVLLFLFSCSSTYPLKTSYAGVLTGLSYLSYINIHMKIADYCEKNYEPDVSPLRVLDGLALAACCIGLPLYFFSKTPKMRLADAQIKFNEVCSLKILQKYFSNKEELYCFISKEYAEYKWPLLAAKLDLGTCYEKIEKSIKSVKSALEDVQKDSYLFVAMQDIECDYNKVKKEITKLLDYINQHPDYQKMIAVTSQIDALNNLANAEHCLATACWAQAFHYHVLV